MAAKRRHQQCARYQHRCSMASASRKHHRAAWQRGISVYRSGYPQQRQRALSNKRARRISMA